MTRLWTDSELQAAHSLAEAVMTPPEPQETPIPFHLTAKRQAFEEREKARHARLQRQQRQRPKLSFGGVQVFTDDALKNTSYLLDLRQLEALCLPIGATPEIDHSVHANPPGVVIRWKAYGEE